MHSAPLSPVWGPNGEDVYSRTYARTKPDGSLETWADTVERVVDGNLALVADRFHQPSERERLFELIYSMKILPAGRHLWVSGVPGRQFNRNCHRAGWGPSLSDHFTFTFSELMKGGGVGANYSSEYLTDLPRICNLPRVYFSCSPSHPDYDTFSAWISADVPADAIRLVVDDSREGWAEAMGLLIDSFTKDTKAIAIDVSNVRAAGAPIRGFGGIASGPGPLLTALNEVSYILSRSWGQLTPIRAMEIDHALASCVVAGNVRRSARMSILHWADPFIGEFLSCKADHANHWSTNISVEVDNEFFKALEAGSAHAQFVFDAVTAGMLTNGEPGFYNSSLASVGEVGDVRSTNPCGEIALQEWESCNLGHVNLAAFPEFGPEVLEAFRLMARFLIRATFAPLTDIRQAIVEATNRRIGVGFFGFQEWAASRGVKYSQIPQATELELELMQYRDAVSKEALEYAWALGINVPIKTTTVAPTGTIAKLPGVTEGIHPVYSRYFERRIRYAANDPKLIGLEARGLTIEDCIYSANTKVVVHHVADPITEKFPVELIEQADEIPLEALAGVQAMVQRAYANNAVSFTMNVPPGTDVNELRSVLREFLPQLKGTTVMVDQSRPQSPYTRLSLAEYLAATDHEVGQSEMDCATGACPIR